MKRDTSWAGLSAFATACTLVGGCVAIALLQVSAADDVIESRAEQLLHATSIREVVKRQVEIFRRVPHALAVGFDFGMVSPMRGGTEDTWELNRDFLRDVTGNVTEGEAFSSDTYYCAVENGHAVFGSFREYEGGPGLSHVLRATAPGAGGAPGPIMMSLMNSNETWAEIQAKAAVSTSDPYDPRARPWYQFAKNMFNTKVTGLAAGKPMPRDLSAFSDLYNDVTTNDLVMTAVVPVAATPYGTTFAGVCAADVGLVRLRKKVASTFQNQQLDGAYTMALVRGDGQLVFGEGGAFRAMDAAEELATNLWTEPRLAAKGALTHTLRRTWGDQALAKPGDPIWNTQGNTSVLSYVTEDRKMLSITPLGYQLFEGEDLYVIVAGEVDSLRVGLGAAIAITVAGSGTCIALLCAVTMLSTSPRKLQWLDRALSVRIGPIFLHSIGVVEPALVGLTLFLAFGAWSLFLESVLSQVTSDLTTSLTASAVTQVAALARAPYMALTLLNAAFATGTIVPHNQTNAGGQFGVQTYAAHACSTFRTATTCALATDDEVSGAYRFSKLTTSETKQVYSEFGVMQTVSLKTDRRYNLTTSWPPTADALLSQGAAYNVSGASWYKLGRAQSGFQWSAPAVIGSSALAASLVTQAEAEGQPQSTVNFVDVSLDEVSRMLSETVGKDLTSIIFAIDVRSVLLTGSSKGNVYQIADEDGTPLPVTADASEDAVVAFVAKGLLDRLRNNLTVLANGPFTTEVGTPNPESPTLGRFAVRAELVGDAAPWAVVTAFRKDILAAASDEKSNSGIVYSLGVMACTIMLASLLRAGITGPAESSSEISEDGATDLKKAPTPEATATEAAVQTALSNAEIEDAHEARISKLKTELFSQIWPLIGNLEAVMRPGGGRRWVGPSVGPRDPLWLESPMAPQDSTLFHQLIAGAVGVNRASFAFGTSQFDALEEATCELAGAARSAAGVLRHPFYKVGVLLLSAVHCTVALFEGSSPAMVGIDVTITLLRVLHVAAMWTHRAHVLQRGRPYRTGLLVLRTVMTSMLLVDVIAFIALGDRYEYSVPVTSMMRPFLLATETDSLINSLVSFVSTVATSSDVFVFFFLFLFIATVGGMSLFADREGFGNFFDAVFSMFNFMTTTDNYTDLVLSAGSASDLRREVIFYVVFAVIGFFVFVSLVIAVFQETFVVLSNVLKQESELMQTARAAAFLLLHRATRSPSSDVDYHDMRADPNAAFGKGAEAMDKELSQLEADRQQLRSSDKGYQSLRIHRSVFRRFLRYSHPTLQAVVFEMAYPQSFDFDQFCSLMEQVDFLPVDALTGSSRKSVPKPDTDAEDADSTGTESTGPTCHSRLAELTQSPFWRSGVLAVLLLLAWLLAAGAVYDGEQREAADWAASICCYLLSVEVGVRVYAVGPTAFFHVPDDAFSMYTNRLDAIIAIVTLLALSIAQGVGDTLLSGTASPVLRSLLTLPIFRLFAYFGSLRVLFFSIIHVLGIYVNMLLVLVLFTISFSLLGTLTMAKSFGPEADLDFDPAVVNFDSPTASSGTLYQLMLQAEWGDIASTFALFRGRLALLYFVVFVFVQGILLANLFSGVLCEGFIFLDDLKSVLHHNKDRVSLFIVNTMLRGMTPPPLLTELDSRTDTLFIYARESRNLARPQASTPSEEDAAAGSKEAMDNHKVGNFVRVVRDLDREVASAIRKLPVSEDLKQGTTAVAPPLPGAVARDIGEDEATEDYVGALEEWANARLEALGAATARALGEVGER